MLSFEKTMNLGQARYQDIIDVLVAQGLPTIFTQTGGMCAALEVRLESGYTLLITDAGDTLAWDRATHHGWAVGLYQPESEYDDGPLAYGEDEDGSARSLLPLVQQVLGRISE